MVALVRGKSDGSPELLPGKGKEALPIIITEAVASIPQMVADAASLIGQFVLGWLRQGDSLETIELIHFLCQLNAKELRIGIAPVVIPGAAYIEGTGGDKAQ